MRMDGKTCLVTGAAMGLGQAQAETLAREGARVILTDIDSVRGSEAAADRALFLPHDVRDEGRWRR